MSDQAEQLEFPSVAFDKDRRLLYPHEIAQRLSCSVEHVHDLITEGRMKAINIAGGNNLTNRSTRRVPVEFYNAFLSANVV